MTSQFKFHVSALALALSLLSGQAASQPASSAGGATLRDCPTCPEMVTVPAGTFMMGSSPEELARETGMYEAEIKSEQPKHRVTIGRAFAIGKHEVTQAQYEAFVKETGRVQSGCKVFIRSEGTWDIEEQRSWKDPGYAQSPQHPVACVRWADAQAYADWLAAKTGKPYRLPSEAEWEYAARGGTTGPRFWGDTITDACRFANVSDETRKGVVKLKKLSAQSFIACADGHVWAAPVGSFVPNGFGIHDMLGNLWEWTADCYHPSYEGAPQDGSARKDGACTYHAFRGGAFSSLVNNYRVTQRGSGADPKLYADDPREYRADYLGFRVARDLP
jgi:formylglycine-generating enzyme required for sulfatase activity